MERRDAGRGRDRRRSGNRSRDRAGICRSRLYARRQLSLRRRPRPSNLPRGRAARSPRAHPDPCRRRGSGGRTPPARGDDAQLTVGSTSGSTTPASRRDERLDLLETTPESWDRVLDTNLRGPFFLTQAVARAMIELRRGRHRSPSRRSCSSRRFPAASPASHGAEYCVAKAGLSMVAQLFAARLAEPGSASTRSGRA